MRFTETIDRKAKEFGISVNAIASSAVNTKILKGIIPSGDDAGERELIY